MRHNRSMIAAILGLVGVLLGLAIGRGYGFWASRREELAKATVALAVIEEELRLRKGAAEAGSRNGLQSAWREHRQSLVIHFSPADYRRLADSVMATPDAAFEPDDLIGRIDALYDLFWDEHEAFILVPLIHYVKGHTVSKRVRSIMHPGGWSSRGEDSPPGMRSWHSPP